MQPSEKVICPKCFRIDVPYTWNAPWCDFCHDDIVNERDARTVQTLEVNVVEEIKSGESH